MNHIKELQNLFGAWLHLLFVNTPSHLKKTSERVAEVNDFARAYNLDNYTTNLRDDNHENDAIVAFAKEIKADMIAMGTHGRRGLSHLFTGSIAEDVVNHASCPIWTFPIRK
jgi:nucleotide-binding universal stress UspA family protein